ncbi:MAG TPA: hemolysin family protein [Candidatus Udaeobacter sp.]|jgi:putative hemolysin|nr:hemolysin family protein [Candidatus Udaeobacter sp.]
MTSIGFEILFIMLLIMANGIFAMSEIALVAARKSRLQDRAEKGDHKAKAALELANQPNQFLSTVQIGITLVGILAGAFGGRTLANKLAAYLSVIPGVQAYSEAIAVVLIVICITYFSVIIGELVPKRIALTHPESIAAFMAIPMRMVSAISSPVVRLLTLSTDAIFRLVGSEPVQQPLVTEEEVRTLIKQGTAAGVFEASEQDMIEAVISLGDKSARALMTPRTQIVWFDLNDSAVEIRKKISESGHSRFPVCRGGLDDVVGVAQAKDLLASALAGKSIDLSELLQQPAFVPRSMAALQVLEQIKASGSHLVLVVDEYGGIEGLLTHHDILEAIAGEMPFGKTPVESKAVQRSDGSWLLDGMLTVDEFKEIFHLDSLPGEKRDAYQTLGGFLFTQMGRVPSVPDRFEWNDLCFEIVDMDGKRIDKVLVSTIQKKNPATS